MLKFLLGTLIYDNVTNDFICDIINHRQEVVVAKGGKGGKGNAFFSNLKTNQKNKFYNVFEAGDLGQEIEIRCELKFLSDVCLIGLPNAGKSTLLSKLSKAKPQIADYPFTTLIPQLGVVKKDSDYLFTIVDLPALIEGSNLGKGLGCHFLKHIERCKILLHIIDMSDLFKIDNICENYLKIRNELKLYDYNVELIKEIVVANKINSKNNCSNLYRFKSKFKNLDIIEIFNFSKKRINKDVIGLINKINSELAKILNNNNKNLLDLKSNNNVNYKVYKYINTNKIDIKIINLGNRTWKIKGKDIFNIYNKIPISTYENLLFFNKKLDDLKFFDLLKSKGVKHGDKIRIFKYEFKWEERIVE